MSFVLDTSLTVAWCFEDEVTPESEALLDRLSDEEAVVPALWTYEVSSVLLVAERRGRITEAQTARFLGVLGALPIIVDPADPDPLELVHLGRRHALSSYDAAYLSLAERRALPLATRDRDLTSACRVAGVELLPSGIDT